MTPFQYRRKRDFALLLVNYLVFLFSSYIMFGTHLDFRYALIPVTLLAFFYSLHAVRTEAFKAGVSFFEYEEEEEEEPDV